MEICQNTPVFGSRDDVIAWVNGAVPGTSDFDEFHHAMASCYNGCSVAVCGRALHDQRFTQYRDSTWRMLDEMGDAFWFEQPQPEPEPEPEPQPDPIDPSTMSCGDYAAALGYVDAACEWNGNGACGARGPATNDCEHCCDWASLPFDAPTGEMTSEMSCGEYAEHCSSPTRSASGTATARATESARRRGTATRAAIVRIEASLLACGCTRGRTGAGRGVRRMQVTAAFMRRGLR